MTVLALYSIKGGVGKSTASVNLSYCASLAGQRTLLVDMDLVGSSSHCLAVHARKSMDAKSLVKGGKLLLKQIKPTAYPLLDVLPSTLAYRYLDDLLGEKKHSSMRLKMSLEDLDGRYDLVVIDCAPNMNLANENALMASDLLAVPVIPTPLAVLAYETLLSQLEEKQLLKGMVHPFVSMLDSRKKLQLSTAERLFERPETMRTAIPFASDIEKMGSLQDPVVSSKPKSRGAVAYSALYKELSQYMGMLVQSKKEETI